MELKLGGLKHGFRCYVCKQPKQPRPQERLRQGTVEACYEELRKGKIPEICLDCGEFYDFARDQNALKRYILFLANDAYDETIRRELNLLARGHNWV